MFLFFVFFQCQIFNVQFQLCSSSLGWESVFYLHSVICFIAFVGWFFLYTNSPEHHPLVSKHELADINDGKSALSLRKHAMPSASNKESKQIFQVND
ncbi:hypothetical protein OSTOST_13006 [Ostertagia ostertagi]